MTIENEKAIQSNEHVCCICGQKFIGYGNNPVPIKREGVCCDACHAKVLEARLYEFAKSLDL